LKTGVKQVKQ